MAIQKPGLTTPAQPATRGTPTGPITRTGGAKSAFETALAKKSAELGKPAAATGAVGPDGMTEEQAKFIERTLGQQASRTLLSMPQPKGRSVESTGGIDGE